MKRGSFIVVLLITAFLFLGTSDATHQPGGQFEGKYGDALEREFSFEQDRMQYPADMAIENPEYYMQFCDNPDKMVDEVTKEMKSKDAFGDFESQCKRMEEEFKQFEERFQQECERVKDHEQYGLDKEDMLRHCDAIKFFDPGQFQGMSAEELKEKEEEIGKQEKEEQEQCRKRAEDEYERMQEEQKKFAERNYEMCKERFEHEKDMFTARIKECKESFDMEKMRRRMVEQGIKMCAMYKEKGSDMFYAMKMAHPEERDMLMEEHERIQEQEEKMDAFMQDHTQRESWLQRALQFLGLVQKRLTQNVQEMHKTLAEIDKSIKNLEAVRQSLTDEKAVNALETEIASLKMQRNILAAKVQDIEQDFSGGATGAPVTSELSGFFVRVANFMKGNAAFP